MARTIQAASTDLAHLFVVIILVVLMLSSEAVILAGDRVERFSTLQV